MMTTAGERDDCEPHPQLGAWLWLAIIIIALCLTLIGMGALATLRMDNEAMELKGWVNK